MIYNRSIEGSSSLPQYKAEVTTMLKDMDFGVYGKGIDGYVHYSLAVSYTHLTLPTILLV